MNSASYSAWMAAAEQPDYEVDYEPNARLHCQKCGAFVSGKTSIRTEYPPEPDIIEVDEIEGCRVEYPMPGRPGAVVYRFPCKRKGCGGSHQIEEYI